MVTQREIERTYAPAPEAEVPHLGELPGVTGVGEPRRDALTAVYFDTPELALARAGVSLRRRAGGADEGWHLKVPADGGRDELRLPLGPASQGPPGELRDAVQGWARGAPLAVVATVETHRTTHPVLGDGGRTLAELADDEVTGTRADGESASWREWEVELVEGGEDLLDAAEDVLSRAGAEPAGVQRKLARVLGDWLPEPVRPPSPERDGPAGRVVHLRLAEQVDALARQDFSVRRRQAEGVHRARVACRRLRSALATFRPLFDREATDPLRDELKWLSGALGDVRDATVVRERLTALLDEEPPELVRGPVADRLRTTYADSVDVPAALFSDRYLALRDALDALVSDPPWTELADRPACDVLPGRVRKDWKRLRSRYDAATQADPGRRDEALHDVRKAAKRLRYAGETMRPVARTKKVKRLVRAAKGLTSHLGARQDTVETRRKLVGLAAAAEEDREPSFTYGRLHAREERRADGLDAALPDVWRKLTGPARHWTC